MKTLGLSLFLISLVGISLSCLPSEEKNTISISKSDDNFTWKVDSIVEFKYDKKLKGWNYQRKTAYYYDEKNKEDTLAVRYDTFTNSGKWNYRSEYRNRLKDNNNNLTKDVDFQVWNHESGSIVSDIISEADSTHHSFKWDKNLEKWIRQKYSKNSFDNKGRIIETITAKNAYNHKTKISYVYDKELLIEKRTETQEDTIDTNKWTTYALTLSHFDSFGNEVLKEDFGWNIDSAKLILNSRSIKITNKRGGIISSSFETRFNNTELTLDGKNEFILDEKNQVISNTLFQWNEREKKLIKKVTIKYSYDKEGNIIREEIRKPYPGINQNYIYVYDDRNNLIKEVREKQTNPEMPIIKYYFITKSFDEQNRLLRDKTEKLNEDSNRIALIEEIIYQYRFQNNKNYTSKKELHEVKSFDEALEYSFDKQENLTLSHNKFRGAREKKTHFKRNLKIQNSKVLFPNLAHNKTPNLFNSKNAVELILTERYSSKTGEWSNYKRKNYYYSPIKN